VDTRGNSIPKETLRPIKSGACRQIHSLFDTKSHSADSEQSIPADPVVSSDLSITVKELRPGYILKHVSAIQGDCSMRTKV
jgi:hypothetical protein